MQTTVNAARLNILQPNWKDILEEGIPGLKESSSQVKKEQQASFSIYGVFHHALLGLTGLDWYDRRSVFHQEIPLLVSLNKAPPTVSAMSLPAFPKFKPKDLLSGGKPLVGIYHTHSSESFIPISGESHRRGGQPGDIIQIGQVFVDTLNHRGISAVQSKNIHYYPSFMKAYGPSEITAKKLLEDYPSIEMLFDIHRDADQRENSIVVINGVPVAKILFVVAQGQQELQQPHWQENYAFAKLIDAKLNQYYPGMSKGIQVVEWRYNQHLHPRALLLEVGCQDSTKEELQHSIEMLSDVLAEIIEEK